MGQAKHWATRVALRTSKQDYPAAPVASDGQSRNLDLQKLQTLIREKKLSDHEAEFYKVASFHFQ